MNNVFESGVCYPTIHCQAIPYKASKVGIGVALGLLGLIGLVIGLVLYNDEFEKKTFLKGWIIAFVIEIILGIILGVVISCSAVSMANNLYY